MDTHTTEAAGGGATATVRARLRERLTRRRDQAGSMLLEAVVVMFIITLTVSGFIGVQAAVAKSADRQQIQTAVDQHLTGLAEEVMSMPWSSVTSCRATLMPYTPGSSATPPVQTLNADCPTPGIRAGKNVTIDGRSVSIVTDINWILPSASSPIPADASAYGRKRVLIVARWTNPGAPAQSEARVQIERVPTLDEVAPR